MGPDLISDTPLKLSENDMGQYGVPSDSISSVSSVGHDALRDKMVDQSSTSEHHVHHSPTRGHIGPSRWSDAKDYSDRVAGTQKSSGYYNAKTNSNQSYRSLAFQSNSKVKQSSNFSKPISQKQPGSQLNQLGFGDRSNGPVMGFRPAPRFSSHPNQNHGAFVQSWPLSYQSNGRAWNHNGRYRSQERVGRNGYMGAPTHMTRGPRFHCTKNFSKKTEVEQPVLDPARYKYNSEDFTVEYDDVKFYMIKSISEDDVHKSIKYNVWSSTPYGNRKLDVAFEEYEAKSIETGKECPVFLFFSVNRSGQFVGVAEMIGPVDFTKDLDFWQTKDWRGFFPITWHIIKDLPTTLFQHIILESSEHVPVIYAKDTQEIGLEQGLEMLSIFKNFAARTSIVDDFSFYENRERSVRIKRKAEAKAKSKSAASRDRKKHYEAGGS